jgi:hypothetical protein
MVALILFLSGPLFDILTSVQNAQKKSDTGYYIYKIGFAMHPVHFNLNYGTLNMWSHLVKILTASKNCAGVSSFSLGP